MTALRIYFSERLHSLDRPNCLYVASKIRRGLGKVVASSHQLICQSYRDAIFSDYLCILLCNIAIWSNLQNWSCPDSVDTFSPIRLGVHNGIYKPPYPAEFRQKMVDLVRSRRTPEQLAKEYEPGTLSIRNLVAKADGIERC